jgi:photosystem II stability/assembly factor-like uncharacterized protein
MPRTSLAALFLFILLVPSHADEWPAFRGGARGGVADAQSLPDTWDAKKNIIWNTEVPGRGWSSPVVWGERVFVTTVVSDKMTDPKKGLYIQDIFGRVPEGEHRWLVLCLDFKTGKTLWTKEVHKGKPPSGIHVKNTYASETPVVDGQHVVAVFGNVGIFCLDHAGKLLWSKDLEPRATQMNWGPAASPALSQDRLFLVRDNEKKSELIAFGMKDGKELWRVERKDEKSNWATPFVWKNEMRTELVTAGKGKVRSYDLDGKLLWELGGMSTISIPTPTTAHGLLYVSSGYVMDFTRPVFAIKPGASGDITLPKGEKSSKYIAWYQKTAGPYHPSPLVYGDYLYVLLDRGMLSCYEAKTGKPVYEKQRLEGGSAFTASPWAFDGKVFCLSEDGDTFVVQAGAEFKLLGKNRLDEMTLATPALAGDSIILRTISKVYRIARAEELKRKNDITDLERQIVELTKKLEALRKQPANPKPFDGSLDPEWIKKLSWRGIGPATMGGRIVALAVYEADPSTYWIATASGGLLKTSNNGTTFEHQFDRETTVSIGDVAVAPSNRDIVWVGTGENNPRNSVSYGDGVYRSVDGGKTWKNMGLKKSFQIGRIVIHPKNPDIVYVGALGRLYGPNEERGVFKTSDGGKNWEKVFYLDDHTGIIDMQMNPADPETLLLAAWERKRDGFDSHPGDVPMEDGYDGYDPIKKWGPKSGIYKTTDGGKNWKKLTAGLPAGDLGRIGLDYYRKDPKLVYAVVDSARIGMGPPPNPVYAGIVGGDAEGGAKLSRITKDGPADRSGLKEGDLIVAIDKKPIKNYDDLLKAIQARKPGDKLPLSIKRDKETLEITLLLEKRPVPVFAGINGTDTKEGLKLALIAPKGPAEKAGLKIDDVITHIDKKPLNTLKQLQDLLATKKPDEKLTLTVKRDKEIKEIVLILEARADANPTRPYGGWLGGQRENVQDQQGKDGYQYGGVYRSADGGETWERINSLNPRPMYFGCIRVDPSDEKFIYVCGIALHRSNNGGKTFQADGGNGVHPDQHILWINPRDGRHMLVGTDGGTYVTYDRMAHWDHLAQAAIGQFYHVAIDTRQPYRVYGGLQDNGSWGGPSRGLDGSGPRNDDWIVVGGGDGFVCRVERDDPDVVYFESQDGNMQRRNLRTGERAGLKPGPGKGQPGYRFNWCTPFLLSSHNPRIMYSAGNFVFRSVDRGRDQRAISPEITITKRGSGTALSESPLNPDVLYAGTDDGGLWGTRDGGKTWDNIGEKLLKQNIGLSNWRWVSSIEASRFKEGRVYVVFDGHRSDDDEPYVFQSDNFGETWKSLRANLPWGSTRVLREDAINQDLLYLGTEFACWASLNRGDKWMKINSNLPTVAIHEIAVHPTAGEIVVATHGRSMWILDVSALRQMKPSVVEKFAHLYTPQPAIRWRSEPARGAAYGEGSRHYAGQNPPRGTAVYYSLNRKAEKINLKVVDISGRIVRELKASPEMGLHRIDWNLRRATVNGETPVENGVYRVVLTVDGEEMTQSIKVEGDPTLPANVVTEEEENHPLKKRDRRPDD